MKLGHWVGVVAWTVVLVGCGGSNSASGPDGARQAQAAEPSNAYSMANQCWLIRSDAGYLTYNPALAGYSFQPDATAAEPIYLKPTGLGHYMLFDSLSQWLQASESTIAPASQSQLDNDAVWELNVVAQNQYQFRSQTQSSWLGQANNGSLQLVSSRDAATVINLTSTSGCAEFPEASTNTQGSAGGESFADGAVWGMADVHAHLFGGMAFANNVMAGDVFHPLGVTEALADCRAEHGVNGWLDITGFVTGGPGDELQQISKVPGMYFTGRPFHDTRGYPDFPYWPNATTNTHAMGYYKWVERAYLGGLRLMVNLLVESPPLCKVARELSKIYAPSDQHYQYDPQVVCTGKATAERQLQATLQLQDYVDAQAGGPGKGWFRVVKTPDEARTVIQDKKMAVIIGAELPDLFSCIDGVEGGRANCTEAYVTQKLDEYYDLGIRTLFPVHHYDNDFGGASVFNPIVEIGKVIQNGELFKYEACEDATYDPLLALKIPQIYYNLFPRVARNLPLFPFVPQADHYCNAQTITPLGEFLAVEMMKRGMLIETNHMSPKMKEAVLDMAEAYDYPLVDSHQGKAWDDVGKVFEARYLSLGGVRSPMPNMNINQSEYGGVRKTCNRSTSQDLAMLTMAIGDLRESLGVDPGVVISTDVHGMVSQAQPRFGELANCDEMQFNPVEYPFTSFDGRVVFERQQTGNRVFDYNTDGLAHYGLIPDMVEDMRRQGMPDEKVERLFRGAESYLQMWEKARQRGVSIQAQTE